MPLCLMAMGGPVFGYAKPVPYNPMYFKNLRKGEAIVGLAGPAANLAMAILAAFCAWILLPVAPSLLSNEPFAYFYLMFLPMFAQINLYLMFFNLLPIPPLDGSSIIALFLNDKQACGILPRAALCLAGVHDRDRAGALHFPLQSGGHLSELHGGQSCSFHVPLCGVARRRGSWRIAFA